MSNKQKWGLILAFALIILCFAGMANAQTVQKTASVQWTNPTKMTDGAPIPATGPESLAKIQVFMAAAPIADTSTMAPSLELGPGVTTATHTITAGVGGKVHVRVKACNVALVCSDFSAPTSVDVTAGKPGVPTQVTITINFVNPE